MFFLNGCQAYFILTAKSGLKNKPEIYFTDIIGVWDLQFKYLINFWPEGKKRL